MSAAVAERATAALVIIGAGCAVARVASVASAVEARDYIYACLIAVADTKYRHTFVNVSTICQPVTSVTTAALTLQNSADILTSSVFVAGRRQIASCKERDCREMSKKAAFFYKLLYMCFPFSVSVLFI